VDVALVHALAVGLDAEEYRAELAVGREAGQGPGLQGRRVVELLARLLRTPVPIMADLAIPGR
jgi:hypothetical protein